MKNVVILYTGGTLGMAPRSPSGRVSRRTLTPERFERELVAQVPELEHIARIETRILCNLDSSDIGHDEWSQLAAEIASARQRADGIVLIHGTDTMAYTASALSFAISGLDRPVILTGSQRPLKEVRTDARRNLVDAVDLAIRDIPEVGICFDGLLLRGNRASKGDAWSYAAFASSACAPLARIGLDVEIAPHVRRPTAGFSVDARFDDRVAVAYVTPAMKPGDITRLVERGGARGLVLVTFGVGNVPLKGRSMADAVKQAIRGGVTVLAITQARSGTVDLGRYDNGAALADAGVISGGDMGIEAAVVKLMHALAIYPATKDRALREQYLLENVAGERGGTTVHLDD